jgi:hypothetical protein
VSKHLTFSRGITTWKQNNAVLACKKSQLRIFTGITRIKGFDGMPVKFAGLK